MYSCIIFDVDGTLIDTEKAVFSSYQRVFCEEFSRDFQPEHMKLANGVPTHEALTRLGFKNVEEAEQRYHRYLMEAFDHAKPFDGILDIIGYLQNKGLTTGLVTSRNKDEVTDDACLQGIIKHFKFVVCASDTIKHKPNPEPLYKLMELADSDPSKTIYIGDTFYDYMCARNAGVKFALALWGAKNIEGIEADYNLKSPAELLEIIG